MDNETLWQDTDALEALRQHMLAFAKLQLKDDHLAEDVVQETFHAAYNKKNQFSGKSSLKTWIFTILKRKIIDVFREQGRYNQHIQPLEDSEEYTLTCFEPDGHWQEKNQPQDWKSPEKALEDSHFWTVFEHCLSCLPGMQGRIFMMKTMLDLDSDEICRITELTTSNLHVLLYRARLGLRACLESSWFEQHNP